MESFDLAGRVILDTADLLIIDKPAGFEAVVTGGGNTKFCLRSILRRLLKCPRLEPVHRLDRDTTGCLLYTKRPELLDQFEKLFRGRQVHKDYLAICVGRPTRPSGTINLGLSRWQAGRQPVRVSRSGQPAATGYRLLAAAAFEPPRGQVISLVQFMPLTGRTHQVRVHAAAAGCPVLGDDQYGQRQANRRARDSCGLERTALHAWRLTFKLPEGQPIKAEAPLPADMRAVLENCFRPEGAVRELLG